MAWLLDFPVLLAILAHRNLEINDGALGAVKEGQPGSFRRHTDCFEGPLDI